MKLLLGSRWSRVLAGLTVLLILLVTLVPLTGSAPATEPEPCLLCGDSPYASDMILNAILFVPLGLFLHGAGLRGWVVVAAALALSTSVEGVQAWLPGRFPSPLDIASNTVGAAVGVLASGTVVPMLRSGATAVRAGALLWGAVLACVVGATVLLAVPEPPSTVYYGQWTPDLGHLERYEGRVVEARLGGEPVPDGRLDRSSPALKALVRDRAPVDVVVEAGPPVADQASIVSIFDEDQREILFLGLDRRDVVFRYISRADRLGLRGPEYRLEGGAGLLEPGRRARVRVDPDGAGVCIFVDEAGRCGIGDEVWSGWTLLLPRRWFRSAGGVVGALWLALLAFPVGLWGGTSLYAIVGWMLGMASLLAATLAGFTVPPLAAVVVTVSALTGAWLATNLRSGTRASTMSAVRWTPNRAGPGI